MSTRAQESMSKEGSVAKPRPMNLVSRNLLSAKKTPPQDSSASHSMGNQELDQSYVSPSGSKLTRNSNQDQASYSQEGQRDEMTLNLPATGNWGGVVNLQAQPAPGNDIQIGRTRLEFHKKQINDHRYLENAVKNLQ